MMLWEWWELTSLELWQSAAANFLQRWKSGLQISSSLAPFPGISRQDSSNLAAASSAGCLCFPES